MFVLCIVVSNVLFWDWEFSSSHEAIRTMKHKVWHGNDSNRVELVELFSTTTTQHVHINIQTLIESNTTTVKNGMLFAWIAVQLFEKWYEFYMVPATCIVGTIDFIMPSTRTLTNDLFDFIKWELNLVS